MLDDDVIANVGVVGVGENLEEELLREGAKPGLWNEALLDRPPEGMAPEAAPRANLMAEFAGEPSLKSAISSSGSARN